MSHDSVDLVAGGKVIINGDHYVGRNIVIKDGVVRIDGNVIDTDGALQLKFEITGDVKSIKTTSGDITVNGSVGTIDTTSGDVDCGDVGGDVSTVSGDVDASSIEGDVSTISGDIQFIKS